MRGIITMLISGCTILSSLSSDRITHKLGAGLTTAISVAMTAIALFGFSVSDAFWQLCLWAIPYGLGADTVDAALNNYVALHLAARHMSWLHCCWGLGASISPYIMQYCLISDTRTWSDGYRIVFCIQIVLTICIFLSLPLWKQRQEGDRHETTPERTEPLGVRKALRIPGVPFLLCSFFGYCAMEATAMNWATGYLVEYHGLASEIAAGYGSLVYLGLTVGRFLNWFIADRIGDKQLNRLLQSKHGKCA